MVSIAMRRGSSSGNQPIGSWESSTRVTPAIEKTIQALKAGAGEVKVLVGGAPLTEDYAAEIGADGYAPDAGAAVDILRSVIRA